MVTVIDFKKALNDAGKEFFTLVLQGELELIKSQATGNYYATAKKASITSTFNEAVCKKLIGKQLPGKIVKVQAEVYDYVIPETGEKVSLDFKYKFEAEMMNEEAVLNHEIVAA